ncbi:UDP-glucose 4-epimerase GalE [Kitasatospora viridis]|uniref:UDP-glucose 4-epimerase n=1 Tax=Kitasatospora viridis TaxID=281105 RepID=A0A561T6Y1_9ACTN|nr:UDP-glucose 4-epimerase GalE [Kitasatospora viridis]TWF82859.1 UDP-galactose 4-epimerase [Kitasatospora viridis]
MKILIAGGAGFIGSTVASRLADHGDQPVVLDSLVTGRREFTEGRPFYQGDIADGALIDRIFAEHPDIEAVVHCAALIVVPESVADPLGYYEANVAKGVTFLRHLVRNGCTRLVFSSSASIYGDSEPTVDESSPIAPLSPYATSKAVFELVLRDVAAAGQLGVVSLRYFNPIGADPQLRTGLQIRTPTHALGRMIDSRAGGRPFAITGTDYPTRDGSGIRDYVHVWDLAEAHLRALHRFDAITAGHGHQVINLGSGTGTTVRELLGAFESVTGEQLPVVEAPARPGDPAGSRPDSARARELLDWEPQFTVEQGIRDSLRWAELRDAVLNGEADPDAG